MKRPRNSKSGLVYSTETGAVCPVCREALVLCSCTKKQKVPKDGIVRLMRETRGRKGKGVTLVNGLPLENAALKKLAKNFKQKCGSGGSIKNGVIEIQGEHRDLLEKELLSLGYRVKRAGG